MIRNAPHVGVIAGMVPLGRCFCDLFSVSTLLVPSGWVVADGARDRHAPAIRRDQLRTEASPWHDVVGPRHVPASWKFVVAQDVGLRPAVAVAGGIGPAAEHRREPAGRVEV